MSVRIYGLLILFYLFDNDMLSAETHIALQKCMYVFKICFKRLNNCKRTMKNQK